MSASIDSIILGLFKLFGSIGVFLFGMKIMSDGIQKVAGERLQKILHIITNNRFTAVLTGFLITAIIQSSSATTVMVVSFVNADLLTLTQAIGVIMGANIGTTVTGWIVSIFGFKVKISILALPIIGIGFPFIFSKVFRRRYIGEIFIGFGLLFLGLEFMKDSVPNINENMEALRFLTEFTNKGFLSRIVFIAAGTVITCVIQSSSAAMAMTLAMADAGWIDYPTAGALILGQNIGTTITAYLASIGTTVNARRAARAHILFNVFGVVAMLIFFDPFARFVDWIVPGAPVGENIPTHLALFHTLFNVSNTLLLIWFIKPIARLVELMVKPKKSEERMGYTLKYITSGLQDTPEINILKAKSELSKMAAVTEKMFNDFSCLFNNPDKKMSGCVEESKKLEEFTDKMQEEISKYLVECARENLNEDSASNVNAMIRIVHEIESIGDSCFNLVLLTHRKYDKKIQFPEEAFKQIQDYAASVMSFIQFIKEHLNMHLHAFELDRAFELETTINEKRSKLQRAARIRLQNGSDIKGEMLFIDIIKHLEHIGDYSLNIAQALRNFK